VYNLPEDAATGSANGCIASYLVKHRFFGGDSIDLRSEQGYVMNRPSLLRLRARQAEAQIEVNIGGRVVLVAKGTLVD
jgi:trans-2,3-dihydro-3-hydroxyanthranilate isomerase